MLPCSQRVERSIIMTDIRAFDAIDQQHLEEIRGYSDDELQRFLEKAGRPPGKYQVYRDRLIAVCLVQGAAQHFIDTRRDLKIDREVEVIRSDITAKGYRVDADGSVISGVKDIDVFFFFEQDVKTPIPNIRNCRKSIVRDVQRLGRRRIDFMKKGLPPDLLRSVGVGDPATVVRRYLESPATPTAHLLAQKSVIGLHPASVFGRPLWTTHRYRGAI
jgi:hypothetical protein